MTGWLIVNEYLNTSKFIELQELFMAAAKIKGIELSAHTNAEFVVGCSGIVENITDIGTKLPDFIIFYDKDIELARALESMGFYVFNSAESIENCDSKYKTSLKVGNYNREMCEDGANSENECVCIPKTYKVPFTYENIGINKDADFSFLEVIESKIGYPMVIKESYSSFGMGVHLANSREEAVKIISEHGSRECVIQEYIDCGIMGGARDVRLQMVGDKCVAAMMRSNNHDFRANITNGGTMSTYNPTEADVSLAQKVMKGLDLDFAGIDIMLKVCDGGAVKPVFCEANSNAHFKNLYDLTGVNAAEDMLEYIAERI